MKTTLAFVCGILVGVAGLIIVPAKAEKPKEEEKSVAEQVCWVLVRNHIVRTCHW